MQINTPDQSTFTNQPGIITPGATNTQHIDRRSDAAIDASPSNNATSGICVQPASIRFDTTGPAHIQSTFVSKKQLGINAISTQAIKTMDELRVKLMGAGPARGGDEAVSAQQDRGWSVYQQQQEFW